MKFGKYLSKYLEGLKWYLFFIYLTLFGLILFDFIIYLLCFWLVSFDLFHKLHPYIIDRMDVFQNIVIAMVGILIPLGIHLFDKNKEDSYIDLHLTKKVFPLPFLMFYSLAALTALVFLHNPDKVVQFFSFVAYIFFVVMLACHIIKTYNWIVSEDKEKGRLKFLEKALEKNEDRFVEELWSNILETENSDPKVERERMAEFVYCINYLAESRNSFLIFKLLEKFVNNIEKRKWLDIICGEFLDLMLELHFEFWKKQKTALNNNATDEWISYDAIFRSVEGLIENIAKKLIELNKMYSFLHKVVKSIENKGEEVVEINNHKHFYIDDCVDLFANLIKYSISIKNIEWLDNLPSEALVTTDNVKKKPLSVVVTNAFFAVVRDEFNKNNKEPNFLIEEVSRYIFTGVNQICWSKIVKFIIDGYGVCEDLAARGRVKNIVENPPNFGFMDFDSNIFVFGDNQDSGEFFRVKQKERFKETCALPVILFWNTFGPYLSEAEKKKNGRRQIDTYITEAKELKNIYKIKDGDSEKEKHEKEIFEDRRKGVLEIFKGIKKAVDERVEAEKKKNTQDPKTSL